ncbi:MAG: tRNA preQ1(34) S-adenosylmethionine ribosyltransferase-isomerase QueA [Acidobacteria bacterium]|nr:tRNA preQ1(34) S-adenosylmethionine ribosyltransferase-isomerase QueA [Acidobacteriota bacterium]
MRLKDFDYHLPPDLIAQHPAPDRADSRMLVLDRAAGTFRDSCFRELAQILQPGDVLAVNNSRVLPARLFGHRVGVRSLPIGKKNPARREYLTTEIEVLLARQLDERTWEALVRPGRKIRTGEKIVFESPTHPLSHGRGSETGSGTTLEAEVVGRGEYGLRVLRFPEGVSFTERLEKIGHVPLPPYIHRADQQEDRARYQTVYARERGSVAAPTAGLHFTEEMLRQLEQRGIERVEITLHIGLGTFQPIHTEEITDHQMHPESFTVSPDAAERLNRALREKRRIVAVGTTTVRTLEHLAAEHDGTIVPSSGETRLFILTGFQFRVIGGLLTNFHLPRTTLLMLVSAFAGRELVLKAYEHAVQERYRFYSYGDCMLIL